MVSPIKVVTILFAFLLFTVASSGSETVRRLMLQAIFECSVTCTRTESHKNMVVRYAGKLIYAGTLGGVLLASWANTVCFTTFLEIEVNDIRESGG